MSIENDDVPVTGAFLSLVELIHAAREMYRNEMSLAQEMQMAIPEDYLTRCKILFSKTYATYASEIGFKLNAVTFNAIMDMNITDEMRSTELCDLPKKFVFNPWLGHSTGKGGIRHLNPSIGSMPKAATEPEVAAPSVEKMEEWMDALDAVSSKWDSGTSAQYEKLEEISGYFKARVPAKLSESTESSVLPVKRQQP